MLTSMNTSACMSTKHSSHERVVYLFEKSGSTALAFECGTSSASIHNARGMTRVSIGRREGAVSRWTAERAVSGRPDADEVLRLGRPAVSFNASTVGGRECKGHTCP